jgi:hypothetical protein
MLIHVGTGGFPFYDYSWIAFIGLLINESDFSKQQLWCQKGFGG